MLSLHGKYLIEEEKVEAVTDFSFPWAPKSLQMATVAMKLKDACSLKGKLCQTYTKSQSIKKQRHNLADKGLYSQSNGTSRSHVQT